MKRKKYILTEDHVVFFPLFEECVLIRIFLFIFGVILLFCSILSAAEIVKELTVLRVCEAAVTLLASFGLFYISELVYKRMAHTSITVCKVWIIEENGYTDSVRRILWEDVFRIYFYKDPWYGRTSCRIFLKSSKQTNITEKSPCDFSFPLPSDIATNVLPFIPQELWGNDPVAIY